MKIYSYYEKENKALEERFSLASERIREINKASDVPSQYKDYIAKVTSFLSQILDTWNLISSGRLYELTPDELQTHNHNLYEDILPENYANSYANPDYADDRLGKAMGKYLCALYAELRGNIVYVYEQHLQYVTMTLELFLEVYSILTEDDSTPEEVQHALYYYCFDYADIIAKERTLSPFTPDMSFARDIIMNADLSDLRYLYYFGEYISDNELQTAKYLNSLPDSRIQEIASTYTEGFRKGFSVYRIDLSGKKTVNIRYSLGFERIIRAAIIQFQNMGLSSCIYRTGVSMATRSVHGRIGYFGASANKQYDYDHRMDDSLIFDKAYADRRLAVQRTVFSTHKEAAAAYAGPAVMETFGEIPFTPIEKESCPRDNDKQRATRLDYQAASSLLTNEFIPGDTVSYTIIAFPVPEIGEHFTEVFDDTIRVNTLNEEQYCKIQTQIINALDKGETVTVTGRGDNRTNLTIALTPLTDADTQTKFENCLADVNIPLGEVFTSPQLKGTSGTLHVTKSFLNGLEYRNLSLEFRDGIVTDYNCTNYDDSDKNRKYIQDTLLFQHETLPMGEFAIGTNTTAYAMGEKYGISHLLPILIEEKTGPHFAIGDTCFSHEEEMRTYNPDGKEMIAKENDYSRLRHTDSRHAYFNCHTDITIPYRELGDITVNCGDGSQISIMKEGRFVLPGTEKLNDAFTCVVP
ncbi:MAG: aminopeptidase [Lachnospiraceae bacterium]|nr:aminopeptidase [Lachnospiraceae bacterium]